MRYASNDSDHSAAASEKRGHVGAEICTRCGDDLHLGSVYYDGRRRVCKECYYRDTEGHEELSKLDTQAMIVAALAAVGLVGVLITAGCGL